MCLAAAFQRVNLAATIHDDDRVFLRPHITTVGSRGDSANRIPLSFTGENERIAKAREGARDRRKHPWTVPAHQRLRLQRWNSLAPWNNAICIPILWARKATADRRVSFLSANTVRDDGLPFQEALVTNQIVIFELQCNSSLHEKIIPYE